MTGIGERYVEALVAKDTDALLGLFAEPVEFRGMTPNRFWEASSGAELVHAVLYQWFEPTDVVEGVDLVEVGTVVDRVRVDYRLRIRNP